MSHYPQYPTPQQPTIPLVGIQPPQGYGHVNQPNFEPDRNYGPPPPQFQQNKSNLKNRVQWKLLADKIHKRHSAMAAMSRGISAFLNAFMFAFMALVMVTFYSTKDEFALGRNIWPSNWKTWPTILLLVASFLTFFASLFTMVVYCCCFKRASNSWKLVAFQYIVHIGVWLMVTFIYRYEKALNDLWGWSCSDIAKDLQQNGHASVNFGRLCSVQEVTWYFSLVETIAKILFAITSFLLFRKSKYYDGKMKLTEGLGEGSQGLLSAFT